MFGARQQAAMRSTVPVSGTNTGKRGKSRQMRRCGKARTDRRGHDPFSTTRRAVLAGLVLSTAVFAAPAFAEKAKIKIGFMGPLSGGNAQQGLGAKNGFCSRSSRPMPRRTPNSRSSRSCLTMPRTRKPASAPR
ncbi:hypothetical protein QWZ10_21810 [Paracoccus cavernae]|uniref:Leucine-binding protein domain-containing protein n=1 Tax=Paracoccus cavernae TaxID=1571207 RepID=A0ABT8DAA9_9RHOB|nr:hypothetical protein [Paracoccus cavernae]